jgi:serine/threonine protein kinase
VTTAISERGGETTRLGSYEIVRRIARGGMAEIFLARTSGPSGFEKLLVLKKILPKYANAPRMVQLFLDEAKLAASLDHPHIAQVYDIGMVDGSYFFTMEYLHGQDVRSMLHRTWKIGERFAIEHAVQIARHVASALHFAHEKAGPDGAPLGIVHRDVSPSNVIVTYDGATKLLDFGVAKTAARTVKTRTGALKGKISYMSPEQARGSAIDRRSDIFSLGIVLWEMVTTQRLYRGENDLATLQLIITQPARPPSAVRDDIPAELERIILRALAQDPADRYQTAAELGADLDELAREQKLKQTSSALSASISELFAPELGAWREARAAGVPLAEHLHDAGDMTTPVSESDFIELEAIDDDDEDDDEDLAASDTAVPVARPVPAPPRLPTRPPEVEPPTEIGHRRPSPLNERTTARAIDRQSERAILGLERPSDPDLGGEPGLGERPSDPVLPAGERPSDRSLDHDPPTSLDGRLHAGDEEATALAATTFDPPVEPLEPMTPSDPVTALLPPVETTSEPTLLGHAYAPPPAPVMPGAPFAAPPWQAGQPEPPRIPTVSDRIHRSWAVIDLPAFDPETFARQRKLVLRITGGLVGVILLLAILAGRC